MHDPESFSRMVTLVRAAIRVLRGNKRLLIYPVVSIIAYTAAFGALFYEVELVANLRIAYWVWILAFYLSMMFALTFTGVAFNHEAMQTLSGEPVSLSRGLIFALRRIKAVFLWSLLAGLVGVLIQLIWERSGFLGKVILGFTGTAWSVASVFVLQVMIRDEESSNPVTLLRKSAATICRNHPKMELAYASFTWRSFVPAIAFALIFMMVILYIVVASTVPALDFGDLGLGVLLIVFGGAFYLTATIIESVFRCALYIYETEGVIPTPFDAATMNGSWIVR